MLEAIPTNPVEPISSRFTSMPPLSPLLVVTAALSVAREGCFFFSALQALTQIFSLSLCLCVHRYRKGKEKVPGPSPALSLSLTWNWLRVLCHHTHASHYCTWDMKFIDKGIIEGVKVSRLYVTPGKICLFLQCDPVRTPVESKYPILCYHFNNRVSLEYVQWKSYSNFRFI